MTRGHAALFLERGWQLLDGESPAPARARKGAPSAGAGVALGDALRAHATAVQPSWPRPSDRAGDHAHHLRLIDILSRVERQRR